jgi:hypothetical protein
VLGNIIEKSYFDFYTLLSLAPGTWELTADNYFTIQANEVSVFIIHHLIFIYLKSIQNWKIISFLTIYK